MSSSSPPVLGQATVFNRRDPADRLPNEGTIAEDAAEIFEDPQTWLSTAHPSLGGKRPLDCIGAPDEQAVRDLLRTIRRVGVT